jgi:hypothetical protein
MSSDHTWQDVLKQQQDELRRLELMNEALDAGNTDLNAGITKALKKNSTKVATYRPSSGKSRGSTNIKSDAFDDMHNHDSAANVPPVVPDAHLSDHDETTGMQPTSPEIDASKAPDTAAKYVYATSNARYDINVN